VATSDGSTWATQASNTTVNLNGVSFPSGYYQGFAAGDGGVIDEYTCPAGTLGLATPASLSFPGVTLNGQVVSTTTTATFTIDDETGSLAGWNLSAYATALTDSGNHTLPSPTVTAGSAAAATGTCVLPTNSVSYPTTALGTGSGSATKLFNAATATGSGPAATTLTFKVTVPANQLLATPTADSFSSTVTFTASSGP
jgi:hypothetical protein